MKIPSEINSAKNKIKSILSSSDIIFFDFNTKQKNGFAVYVDSLTNKENLGDLILRPLSKIDSNDIEEIKTSIFSPECEAIENIEDAVKEVIDGCTMLFFDGLNSALKVDLKKFDSRSVDIPPTSTVIKGPREGFTESIKTNISLIRRRIKSEDLIIESLIVGKYSQTNVSLVHINSICNDEMYNKVKNKVNKINIDAVIDSSYIAKLIIDKPSSLFKQIGTTEKPDIFASKILEGRIGIIVDGSPFALTTPYLLIEDFQTSEDYFKSNSRANVERCIRLISIILSVFLPALFVAAQLFHLQLIPLNFLLTIVNSIKGIPLSPSFEMFFTLVIFEILHEASVRMPKYVGMALSIVGALVLGETAVSAGIISSPTIMIMALSAICLYTVPDMVDTMSIMRLIFLIIAGSSGCFGMILGVCFLLIYVTSIETLGVPLLAPFAPLTIPDLKDTFYESLLQDMKTRPISLKPKNKTRQR